MFLSCSYFYTDLEACCLSNKKGEKPSLQVELPTNGILGGIYVM